MDRNQYEPLPDHYGTGREPYRKKPLVSLSLLLFALLIGANLVSFAFLMGYNVGKQKGDTAASSRQPENLSPQPSLSDLPLQLRESLAEVQTRSGSHTGIVLSRSGYILTTAEYEELESVKIGDRSYEEAQLKGSAPELGLTVIRVEAEALKPMSLGLCGVVSATEELLIRYGQPLFSGSSPEWIQPAAQTRRFLAGGSRSVLEGSYTTGDLLLNDRGELIALCVSTAEGVVALPMEELLNLILELVAFGSLDSPDSPGLEVSLLDEAQSLYWDLPGKLMISRIEYDSPALDAGLREGDLLLQIAGVEIHSPADLWEALDACRSQSPITIRIYRDSQELELTLEPN